MPNFNSVEARLFYGLTVALITVAGSVGVEPGVTTVRAGGNSPAPAAEPVPTIAPTPTAARPTPTPDALDIQIANALATSTVLAGNEKLAEAEAVKRKQLLDIYATQTAKIDRINALNGTPTVTPTFTRDQIIIRSGAGLLPTNTPSPSPEPVPTESTGEEGSSNTRGGSFLDNLPTIDQILMGLGVAVGLSAIGASLHRWRNRAWFWQ